MEVWIYGLGILSTVLLGLVGVFYADHKRMSIGIFFIGILIADVAVCLFWWHKVNSPSTSVVSAKDSIVSSPSDSFYPSQTQPAQAINDSTNKTPADKAPTNQEQNAMSDKKTDVTKQPSSINQTMTDSPGGIQSIGDNVTINQGRLRRELTAEKRQRMLGMLAPAEKSSIEVSFALNDGEAHTFARQLVNFLNEVGWQARLGAPTIEGTVQSGLCIFANNRNVAGAGALQKALEQVGFPTAGRENPEIPVNEIRFFVGSRP